MKTDEQLIKEARKFIAAVATNTSDSEEDQLFWVVILMGGSINTFVIEGEDFSERPWVLHRAPDKHLDTLKAIIRRMNTLRGYPDFVQTTEPMIINGLLDGRHLGSDFNTFLEEEGILELPLDEVEDKILDWLNEWKGKRKREEGQMSNIAFLTTLGIAERESQKERRLTALIDYCQTGDADYIIKGEGK